MQVPHRVEVVRPGGPDLDRGAVGQQAVHTGLGVCAHVALPGPATAGDAELPRTAGHRDDGLPGAPSADPCPPAASSSFIVTKAYPAVIDPTRRSSSCMRVAFGWKPQSCARARCWQGKPAAVSRRCRRARCRPRAPSRALPLHNHLTRLPVARPRTGPWPKWRDSPTYATGPRQRIEIEGAGDGRLGDIGES